MMTLLLNVRRFLVDPEFQAYSGAITSIKLKELNIKYCTCTDNDKTYLREHAELLVGLPMNIKRPLQKC